MLELLRVLTQVAHVEDESDFSALFQGIKSNSRWLLLRVTVGEKIILGKISQGARSPLVPMTIEKYWMVHKSKCCGLWLSSCLCGI